MDYITNRAVLIGVGIFVTLIIVTMVLLVFNEMKGVYGAVGQTDTDIFGQFSDVVSMYNGTTMNGVELVNTLKKYEDDLAKPDTDSTKNIEVIYPERDKIIASAKTDNIREVEYLNDLMKNNKIYEGREYRYEDKYQVEVYIKDSIKESTPQNIKDLVNKGITVIEFVR